MGRNIPSYHDYHKKHPIVLSLTFLIACIAATIAVVWSLCGALSRKKPPGGAPVGDDETPPSQKRNHPEKFPSSPPPAKPEFTPLTPQPEAEEEDGSIIIKNDGIRRYGTFSRPLPPPPSRSASCHVRSHSQPVKLESSVSERVSTSSMMIMMRQGSRRGDQKYLKHEDSVWKKAIILGEKCRVPDEDEEAIVYDEKGKRISTYHPKTKSNAFEILSRQNSIAEEEEKFIIHNE
nr:Phosphatidylinositol 3,4,5-trisphosphate 5-phosphatase [Ipomoea batatas]